MEAGKPCKRIKGKVETGKMRRLPTPSGYPFCPYYFGGADPYTVTGVISRKIN